MFVAQFTHMLWGLEQGDVCAHKAVALSCMHSSASVALSQVDP